MSVTEQVAIGTLKDDIEKQGGWTLECDPVRRDALCYHKFYPTPTKCFGNQDKPGLLVCLYIYPTPSMELEIRGELRDGTWIKLDNYSLPLDVAKVLTMIPRMLAAWEAMNE